MLLIFNDNGGGKDKKMLMQNEQLILKNFLKCETDQRKSKSTDFYAKSTNTVTKQTFTIAKPKVIH